MIHLDTTFLVDLQREAGGRPGAASAFLAERPAEALVISMHALCELEAGVRLARHPERERQRLHALIEGVAVAYPDDRFVETYAHTFVVGAARPADADNGFADRGVGAARPRAARDPQREGFHVRARPRCCRVLNRFKATCAVPAADRPRRFEQEARAVARALASEHPRHL